MATKISVCQNCAGSGLLSCGSCYCKQCGGVGTIRCIQCVGKAICPRCQGKRKIQITRNWLIFSRVVEVDCEACFGHSHACPACQGRQHLKCPGCEGLRYLKTCPQCSGTRQLTCPKCKGTGQSEINLPSQRQPDQDWRQEWKQSLASMSQSDLHFEHEKHRSVRANLEITLSRLDSHYHRAFDYYQSSMEQARREGGLASFDFRGNKREVEDCQRQLEGCHAKIRETDEILSMIEGQLQRLRETRTES